MAVKIEYSKSINVEDLDTVYITGGGLLRQPFKGISRESAWGREEVVWNANLSRSSSFVMTNIDNVGIGTVTNVELTFPVVNMKDFILLQKLLHERHVIVDYFSVDDGKRHIKEMAITGNTRGKIYNHGTRIIGMRDVSIKFVATNRKIDEDSDYKIGVDLKIIYNANGGEGENIEDLKEYTSQYVIRSAETYKRSGYHIEEWNTEPDGSGATYLPNLSITINNNLTLYAIWR